MTVRPNIFATAIASFLCLSSATLAYAQNGQSGAEQPPEDFSDIQNELEEAEKQAENGDRSQDQPAPDGDTAADSAPDTDDNNPALAQSEAALSRMGRVIDRIDENATRQGNNWELTLDDRQILVVTDVNAGRMRIMTAIAAVKDLPESALLRLMQANFDSALDARYAVAQNLVWGTFIHPLPSLSERDFASGLLQTKTVADTFGTTFSSGALTFGGGDSNGIITEELEALLKELEKNDAI